MLDKKLLHPWFLLGSGRGLGDGEAREIEHGLLHGPLIDLQPESIGAGLRGLALDPDDDGLIPHLGRGGGGLSGGLRCRRHGLRTGE